MHNEERKPHILAERANKIRNYEGMSYSWFGHAFAVLQPQQCLGNSIYELGHFRRCPTSHDPPIDRRNPIFHKCAIHDIHSILTGKPSGAFLPYKVGNSQRNRVMINSSYSFSFSINIFLENCGTAQLYAMG